MFEIPNGPLALVAHDFDVGTLGLGVDLTAFAEDLVAEFATDADTDLNASDITFTTATIDGAGTTFGDIGFTFTPGSDVGGSFSINTEGAVAFAGLMAGDTADVVVSFTVSDGASSDDGVLTFFVSGTENVVDVEVSFLGATIMDEELSAAAGSGADDDPMLEIIATGATDLEEILTFTDFTNALLNMDNTFSGTQLISGAAETIISDNNLTVSAAFAAAGGSATATSEDAGLSIALSTLGSTATAFTDNMSDALASADANSQATSVANNNSTATAVAEQDSLSQAAADNTSTASAETEGNSEAISVADGSSTAMSVATDNSNADALTENSSNATAEATNSSEASATSDNTSTATATSDQDSDATATADGVSTSTAEAEDGSTASADAVNSSVSETLAEQSSDATAIASGGSDALSVAMDMSTSTATGGGNSSATASATANSTAGSTAETNSTSASSANDGGNAQSTASNSSVAASQATGNGADENSTATATADDASSASATSGDSSTATATAQNGSAATSDATTTSDATSTAVASSVSDATAENESMASAVANDSSSATSVAADMSTANTNASSLSIMAGELLDLTDLINVNVENIAGDIQGITISNLPEGSEIAGETVGADGIITISGPLPDTLTLTVPFTAFDDFELMLEAILPEGAENAMASAIAIQTIAIMNTTPMDDVITGSPGDDVIDLLAGDDIVDAGAGDDTLIGGPGVDVLNGEAGNDTFITDGLDQIDGGAGVDTVNFSSFDAGVVFDLDVETAGANQTNGGTDGPSQNGAILDAPPAAGGQPVNGINLVDIENAIGSDFDDGLFGNNEVNVLQGGAGNDTVHGFAGDDFQSGGDGTDTVLFAAAPQGVIVDLNDQVSDEEFENLIAGAMLGSVFAATGGAGNNVLSGFENVIGSLNDDTITGDENNNTLNGNEGDDILIGGLGTDTITGGEGDDSFAGDAVGLDGDTILDFMLDDQIVFFDEDFNTVDISFDQTTGDLSIDTDKDGTTDTDLALSGSFDTLTFVAVDDGDDTILSLAPIFDQTFQLADGVSLNSTQINGIVNQALLDSDGTVTFDIGILDLGFARLNNSLGFYEIDANGEITRTELLVNNTNEGGMETIEGVAEGSTLGFFIIQDGAAFADGLADGAVLSFVDANGAPATVNAGPITLQVDGLDAGQTTFHSFDASLNMDGFEHVISGIDDDGTITVGFEDLTGLGDADFEDVVFTIDVNDTIL